MMLSESEVSSGMALLGMLSDFGSRVDMNTRNGVSGGCALLSYLYEKLILIPYRLLFHHDTQIGE